MFISGTASHNTGLAHPGKFFLTPSQPLTTRLTASPGRGLAGAGGQGEEEGSGMLSFDLNGSCHPSTKTKLYQGDEQLFNENALGWSSRVEQQK